MNIVVLIKQVPDTESQIEINPDGVSINTEDIRRVINPYDEIALEEALRIKEQHGGKVIVLCLGAQKAAEAIRTAFAMGVDEGILILDTIFDGSDALRTIKILAAALKPIEYDIIIAGLRSVDFDNSQIGPGLAEILDIPFIGMVVKQRIDNGKITCSRTIDGGTAVLKATLPCLFSTQRGLNEPRYTSLPGIMKAKKKQIEIKSIDELGIGELGIDDIGIKNAKVGINGLYIPTQKRHLALVEAPTVKEKAAALAKIIHSDIGAC